MLPGPRAGASPGFPSMCHMHSHSPIPSCGGQFTEVPRKLGRVGVGGNTQESQSVGDGLTGGQPTSSEHFPRSRLSCRHLIPLHASLRPQRTQQQVGPLIIPVSWISQLRQREVIYCVQGHVTGKQQNLSPGD